MRFVSVNIKCVGTLEMHAKTDANSHVKFIVVTVGLQ